MKNEKILVIPTSEFHAAGYFQGFASKDDHYLQTLLSEENVSFRPRPEMEKDPSFKQLIPYLLLRYTDAAGVEYLFRYVRGKGMGEGRLHEKHSVGVGGHISEEDVHSQACHNAAGNTTDCSTTDPAWKMGWEAYQLGMQRELFEEVDVQTPYRSTCVGLINDDLTEVGTVHLGIVHILDVETPNVFAKETDLLTSGFVPIEELKQNYDVFESWSSIVIKALFDK